MLEQIKDPHLFMIFLSVWAIIALPILWYWQLLTIPKEGKAGAKIALMSPLIAFLLFVGSCAFIPQSIRALLSYCDTHGISAFSGLEMDKLSQLITLVIACFLLMGFSYVHPKEVRARIWGQQGASFLMPFLKGISYCLLTFPLIMLIVQGIHLVVEWSGVTEYGQQVALAELQSLREIPWLFFSFMLAIATVVPLIEEFLFRGLFQNFCADFLGTRWAIITASLLFASFHYSASQEATNIELMIGLVIYSYFIGVFYVREKSLWTAIGMHGTFNALSLFCMSFV